MGVGCCSGVGIYGLIYFTFKSKKGGKSMTFSSKPDMAQPLGCLTSSAYL